VETRHLEVLAGNNIHRLVRVTAHYRLIFLRSLTRWQHPSNPGPSPFVTDLGLKSDLSMHRAHGGSFRVRIEARHEWVELRERCENATNTSRTSQNGLRQQGIWISPFPVSPSGGKPGRVGSPHAGSTLRASQNRWHASMLPAPPTRGLPPPCVSPAEQPVYSLPRRQSAAKLIARRKELRRAATSALTFRTFS
jgi:hypothetical protein